jgi:hypothetical protein
MAYDIERAVFAVTAGQQVYTVGPSGEWNTTPIMGAQATRPTKIEAIGLIDTTQEPDLEVPMHELTEAEYRAIQLKTLSSSWQTDWSYSALVPLGSIFLWPKPTVNRSMAVYLWRQLTTWATVQTNLTLPDGYEEAVVYNLAIRLTPEYGGQASPEVIDVARSSKSLVMRMNTEIPTLDLDPRCPGQRTWGRWNPLTDSYV